MISVSIYGLAGFPNNETLRVELEARPIVGDRISVGDKWYKVISVAHIYGKRDNFVPKPGICMTPFFIQIHVEECCTLRDEDEDDE